MSGLQFRELLSVPFTTSHVVPAVALPPFNTFFIQGTKKEKPLVLPLPFCWQHGWVKAAEQVDFTARHTEILAATWPWLHGPSSMAAPSAGCAKTAPGGHLLIPGRRIASPFFLLKYVISKVLPSFLIEPATCPSSELSGIGSARHSRNFEQLLSQKLPLWLPSHDRKKKARLC